LLPTLLLQVKAARSFYTVHSKTVNPDNQSRAIEASARSCNEARVQINTCLGSTCTYRIILGKC